MAADIVELSVISLLGEGEFQQFLSLERGNYTVHQLCARKVEYQRLVKSGGIRSPLRRILNSIAPDTVFVVGWADAASLLAIEWAWDNGAKVVILSDSRRDDTTRSRVKEWFKRKIVALCDAALVAGPVHRDYIVSLGMRPDCVRLGYDVVDNLHFSSGARIARANAEHHRLIEGLPEKYFLASSRFVPKKNLLGLLLGYRAALRMTAHLPDLVILGDGAAKDEIVAAAEHLQISNRVHLLGFKSYGQLPVYYGLAQAFIHVPLYEQWGLVINEAMAAGVPVVASSECGAAETLVVNGHNGIVVDAHNHRSIAEGLLKASTLIGSTREEIVVASTRAIQEWGPERFASAVIEASGPSVPLRAKRRLSLLDRAILRLLSRRFITDVS